MTCLRGYMNATYAELIQTFGAPTHTTPSGDNKVTTEWVLGAPCGPVTVYDWKEYDGGVRARSGATYRWHVGGTSAASAEWVSEQVEATRYLASL